VQQKNGDTYSYSYVTLANLSDAILPLLAKHGLAFVVDARRRLRRQDVRGATT
jgi:hypothetical protein